MARLRDGDIKITGTDIDKLMPPVSRFGGSKRAEKKQGVISKLKTFFEKYFGIGGSASLTEEPQPFTYNTTSEPTLIVAEDKEPYNTK